MKVCVDGDLHEVGNKFCEVGWCDGGMDFPEECQCGGLIHAEFGDTDRDDNYWLYRKCDKYGEEEGE